ncbi:MAG TPA: hypothetical protein EYG51_03875 [Pseudomonadales bacterium]|nr:hypothetical protein [Pseudomonadales bacterium]
MACLSFSLLIKIHCLIQSDDEGSDAEQSTTPKTMPSNLEGEIDENPDVEQSNEPRRSARSTKGKPSERLIEMQDAGKTYALQSPYPESVLLFLILDSIKALYKVRLVAKGYNQIHGLYYDETFAPVALMPSVMLILNLSEHHDLDLNLLDFQRAFRHSELPEKFLSISSIHTE